MEEDAWSNHYSPIKMLFQIDLPHDAALFVLSEAALAVELTHQPGQFVEIVFDEDAEGVNLVLLEPVLEAQADDWAPAWTPALVLPAAAAAAAAGQQMQAGDPAPAPDFDQPDWPGVEVSDALFAFLNNQLEGHPVLNAYPLDLQPGGFLQASWYAPT